MAPQPTDGAAVRPAIGAQTPAVAREGIGTLLTGFLR